MMRGKFTYLILTVVIGGAGASAQQAGQARVRPAPATSTIAHAHDDENIELPPGAELQKLPPVQFQRVLASPAIQPEPSPQPITLENPDAIELNAATSADLAKQKQAVTSDLAQMHVNLKLQPGRATLLTAANGSANRQLLPQRTVQNADTIPAPGSIMPGMVMSSGATTRGAAGNAPATAVQNQNPVQARPTGTSRYVREPAGISGCTLASNGKLTIGNVDGLTRKIIFTPTYDYDEYTIHGCNFGDKPGSIWISAPNFHLDFLIDTWTDNFIAFHLDPTIGGLLDQDDVTLFVQRAGATAGGPVKSPSPLQRQPVVTAGAPKAMKTGFRFYAAREIKVLSYVPAKRPTKGPIRHLQAISTTNLNGPVQLVALSPVPKFAGLTIHVSRIGGGRLYGDDSDHIESFTLPVDTFDFNGLPPGWIVQEVRLVQEPDLLGAEPPAYSGFPLCPIAGWGIYLEKQWGGTSNRAEWIAPNVLRVDSFETGCVTKVDHLGVTGFSYTDYDLEVHVIGPRGTDPETGLPVSQ